MPFLARFAAVSSAGEHETSQTTLRLTVALLFALLVVASDFGLDVVLGAFLAGVGPPTVGAGGRAGSLEAKLDAVGYGFFIPVFFVTSGMGLDLPSIAENPLRLLVFFVLLLAVRGLPALFLYRRDLDLRERLQMTLLTATALPLLVALAAIGLSTGHMLPENAAALVGAGVLSVIVFPGDRRGAGPTQPSGRRGRARQRTWAVADSGRALTLPPARRPTTGGAVSRRGRTARCAGRGTAGCPRAGWRRAGSRTSRRASPRRGPSPRTPRRCRGRRARGTPWPRR